MLEVSIDDEHTVPARRVEACLDRRLLAEIARQLEVAERQCLRRAQDLRTGRIFAAVVNDHELDGVSLRARYLVQPVQKARDDPLLIEHRHDAGHRALLIPSGHSRRLERGKPREPSTAL